MEWVNFPANTGKNRMVETNPHFLWTSLIIIQGFQRILKAPYVNHVNGQLATLQKEAY